MRITSRTRYITNGKAYVRLGYYVKEKGSRSGHFNNCCRWPVDTPDVTFLYHKAGPVGVLPMSWIQFDVVLPPFLPGFIGIQERLIPKHILEKLNHY